MFNRHLHLISCLLLLPLLTGCPQVQTIRMIQDTPEAVDKLLEQNEFARVRRLTAMHPGIDTTELQARIASHESAYESDSYTQALEFEERNELLSAVELLSGALLRIPHSTKLRELRTTLETQRVHQLKVNERNSLMARADYLLDWQQLYVQQTNLQTPGYEQRRENTQHESERIALSGQLLEHAHYALKTEELDAAVTCLVLAQRLDAAADVAALQAELQVMKQSRQESTRQAVSVRQAKIKRKTDRDEKNETEKLLVTTQEALGAKKLQDARDAFTKIPPSSSQDSEVIAVQNTLDQAVSTQVNHLITTGDAQYRAEKIHEALQTWSAALSLDPENHELRERTDRANKVLTNLEELKRRQQK